MKTNKDFLETDKIVSAEILANQQRQWQETCQSCLGKGTLQDKDCYNCGGKGVIEYEKLIITK